MKDLIAVLHPYLLLVSGFATLTLALLALFSQSREKTKYFFTYFTLGITGYMICYGLMSLAKSDEWAMNLSLIGQIFINQISPALYCYSVFSLDLKSQKKIAILSPILCLMIVALLRTIDIHIIRHFWWGNFNYYGGPDMPFKLGIYFLSFGGFAIAALFNFIRALKYEKNKNRHTQIKYFIVALFFAYLATWDHLPILGIGVYPFGYIPLTIFSAIVFYSITQHQFLDIKIAIRRISLVIVIYMFLGLLSLPTAIPILNNLLKTSTVNPIYIVLAMALIIGTIFSFGPFIFAYFVRNNYWLKGHVTTGLTHELKSPLNTIQSIADILSDQSIDKAKAAEYIDMIKKNAARLENYVQDLLNLAKIQEEAIALDKTTFDFTSLITEVCEANKTLVYKKNLQLDSTSELGLTLAGDPSKLRQVISNLISNAIKFTDKGMIKVEVRREEENVLVSISDSGIGLEKKSLKKIFERFYQAYPNTRGSGIGLTIAKAWVEAHGGQIWAESEGEGKGTTVTFTIPVN